MTSAFPTLSPTASTIRKSFFDASNIGIGTISCNALVAVYPISERKGKSRRFFVVHPTLFELHKTQKDAKNKKAAKHLVDFGDVFNVSMQNEPIQIKEDCISIMDPNSTFFIRPLDSDYDLQAWFDLILERSRECRSTKLLRPVFREEYFESSWDIQIIKRPKLRRDFAKKQMDAQIEDLAEKRPQMLGHRRLCICPSSFLIFSIGCKPSSSVDTPFDKNMFIDLSLNVISNYGTQERYFFVRIGRCSEIGSGELWMATENGASAKSMHERISEINQRESERRRAQGIKINLPTISSSVLKSRAHRERSQTQQNMHKVGSKQRIKEAGEQINNQQQEATESRKVSANSTRADETSQSRQQQHHASNSSLSINSQFDSRHQSIRVDSVSCLQSIPERLLPGENAANSSKKNSLVNLLASRIGSKMSSGSVGKPATDVKMDQLTAPCSPSAQSVGKSFDLDGKTGGEGSQNTSLLNLAITSNQSARNSLVNSVLGIRLNRRNSITNAKAQNPSTPNQRPPLQQSSASITAQPSYDCAEDYMTYDADDKVQCGGHSLKLGSVSSRVSGCQLTRAESRKSSGSYSGAPVTMRQFSTSSAIGISSPDPHEPKNRMHHYQTNLPGDYIEMNMDNQQEAGGGGVPKPSSAEPVFALHEVQSYISNSSESCWTPGSSNTNRSGVELPTTASYAPRAYSLGSRPGNNNNASASNSRPTSTEIGRIPTIGPSQQQLLHPCANNSPPNYLKKTILGQTVKNMKSKEAMENNGKEQQERHGEEQNKDEEAADVDELSADVRKRAYSVGSKTWVKPSLRKLSTAIGVHQKKRQQHEDDFGTSDGDNSRRNTYGAKSMGSCSSSCYPQSMEDHVEIDFDRDESPSMDSIPSMNSRNSSLGKQIPLGVRSALDSLAHSRGFGSPACDKSKGREAGGVQQMKRKRSVPEMFQTNQQQQMAPQSIESGTAKTSPDNAAHQQQILLHPNRRSTCDTSALRLKVGEKRNTQKRSPPRTTAISTSIPSSQSTSSGISSSSRSTAPESSMTTIAMPASGGTKQTKEPIIAEDEDDYVLLSTPKGQQQKQQQGQNAQQQQLTVRSIGTILESSSPGSSLSSDGEGKKRSSRLASRETASALKVSNGADFLDDYSPLIINDKKRASQSSPSRPIANERIQTRLSISSKSSRSPSQSPQPRRKFSAQAQCTPARSYFPVDQLQQYGQSPSPTTRRKTSTATFSPRERMLLTGPDSENSLRKLTCPNLATASNHQKQKDGKRNQQKNQKQHQQQECDYAFISEQDPKLDGK